MLSVTCKPLMLSANMLNVVMLIVVALLKNYYGMDKLKNGTLLCSYAHT